jgi:hypothetical protein
LILGEYVRGVCKKRVARSVYRVTKKFPESKSVFNNFFYLWSARQIIHQMKVLVILGLKILKIFKNACIIKNFSHKIPYSKKISGSLLKFNHILILFRTILHYIAQCLSVRNAFSSKKVSKMSCPCRSIYSVLEYQKILRGHAIVRPGEVPEVLSSCSAGLYISR